MFSNSRTDQALTPAGHFSPRVSFLPKCEPKKPRIIISRLAYAQMNLYVEIAQQEVGWMGTVKRLENGDFLIEKCFLFKQHVHETETEISNEGFSELSMELLNGAVEENEEEWDVNKLRFWGHSHVRMATSPSHTDEQTMLNNYGSGRSSHTGQSRFCFEDSGYPWVIRGIFNKLGEANFAVYLYKEGIRVENLEWTVEEPNAEQIAFHQAADRARQATRYSQPPQYRFGAKPETKPEEQPTAADPDKLTNTSELVAFLAGSDAQSVAQVEEANGTETKEPKAPGAVEPAEAAQADEVRGPQYRRSYEPEPRQTGYFSRVYERPREMKYRPDITPELRASVQADFDAKVHSVRTSWWSRSPSYPSLSSQDRPTFGAAAHDRDSEPAGLDLKAKSAAPRSGEHVDGSGAERSDKKNNPGSEALPGTTDDSLGPVQPGAASTDSSPASKPFGSKERSGDLEKGKSGSAGATRRISVLGETDDRRTALTPKPAKKTSEGNGPQPGGWLAGVLKDILNI